MVSQNIVERESNLTTNRYEEARCAISSIKSVWKKLEPGVISVHDELVRSFGLHLRYPGVLGRES